MLQLPQCQVLRLLDLLQPDEKGNAIKARLDAIVAEELVQQPREQAASSGSKKATRRCNAVQLRLNGIFILGL